MTDTNSIFYQIGLKVKGSVADATAGLLSGDNIWTDTNDFEGAVTVSYADGTALDIKGTASTSGQLTAESLESTGDTDAKGNLTVSGSATISKDLTVEGNLTISGTEAIVDADSLDVTDNIIKLSDGANAGDYAKDSGLYFERGAGKSASAFVFDESAESFVVGTLEGSGGPDVAYGNSTIYQNSLDYVVNEQNQVTAIKLGNTYTSTSTSSNYTNYATALGLYFSSEYNPSNGTADRWQPQFSGGELVKLYNPRKPTWSATLSYDNYTPPTYSNGDIANTTPAPLTVGSLKLAEGELGNLDDFNAGYDA